MSGDSQHGDAEHTAPVAQRPSTASLRTHLGAKVEAALMTADRAVPADRLAEVLEVAKDDVAAAVAALNQAYADTGRTFRIESLAGGLRVMTLAEHADVMAAMHRTKGSGKLTPSQLETLAVVAYKQPALRAEIEAVRGVACGEVLRSLMERHLVKIVGRAEEVGRPMLYGTTRQFLEVFGLASTRDLPEVSG